MGGRGSTPDSGGRAGPPFEVNVLLYIILAILLFGFLIAVHEGGHFAAAKLLGVQVNEFAIGMGPKIFSRKKGVTQYSLRAIPIGGYCAMEGEEEDSQDPGSFLAKPVWKRFIILTAGSFMNYVAGLLILLLIFAQIPQFTVPVISSFLDGFPYESEAGLLPGDRIVSVDGHRIFVFADISTYFAASNGETMDLVIERNGQMIERKNFPLKPQNYLVDGKMQKKYGLNFTKVDATPGLVLKQSWNTSWYFARAVWSGLGSLIEGKANLKDLSGPVGIVSIVEQTGAQSANVGIAIQNILYIIALIAVNLAIVNMLPIPALDGGRIFFMLLTEGYFLLFGRKPDPKYEGYLHMAGFVLLMLLMVVVTWNDIVKLVTRT